MRDSIIAEKKQTAKQFVAEHAGALRAATDHRDLTRTGKEGGFDSRAGFTAYKKALLEAGVDYSAMRAGCRAADLKATAAAATHSLTLYTDASLGGFAVTDENGEPLWYGRFFDGEGERQSDAELGSAKKAVWLAGKVREVLGAPVLALTLRTDCTWLTYQDSPKRKGFVLTKLAKRYGILLSVQWVVGRKNLADHYSRTRGFKKWQANDLTALALPIAKGGAA